MRLEIKNMIAGIQLKQYNQQGGYLDAVIEMPRNARGKKSLVLFRVLSAAVRDVVVKLGLNLFNSERREYAINTL